MRQWLSRGRAYRTTQHCLSCSMLGKWIVNQSICYLQELCDVFFTDSYFEHTFDVIIYTVYIYIYTYRQITTNSKVIKPYWIYVLLSHNLKASFCHFRCSHHLSPADISFKYFITFSLFWNLSLKKTKNFSSPQSQSFFLCLTSKSRYWLYPGSHKLHFVFSHLYEWHFYFLFMRLQ